MKSKNKITKKTASLRKQNHSISTKWSLIPFGEAFDFLSTYSFSRDQLTNDKTSGAIQYIHYGDIHATFESEVLDLEVEKRISFVKDGLISEEEAADETFPLLQDGDLVIADASEDYTGIAESVELKNVKRNKIVGGLHTFVARAKNNKTTKGFRTYVLHNPSVKREIRRVAQGTSVFGISKASLAKILIHLPPLLEQKQIANLLSIWDEVISATDKLIAQKESYNRWLRHQLLNGRIRMSKFVKIKNRQKTHLGFLPTDWELLPLKTLLSPIKKSFTPRQNELYQQIGIRSHTKGIFHKEKVTGKELGEKLVFWIEPNCFIVNIVFAWEHAIAKTTDAEIGMIASHRFPMYKPKEAILDLDYLLYYFKSSRGKHLLGLASPGGAGRNKTLGQSEFVKLQIPVPPIKEQIAITKVLQAADKEIQLLKKRSEKLKQQKKGLMQVLLTGKKRLK